MLRHKTVFVIGAGASDDLGMPLGTKLRSQISNYLRPITIDTIGQIKAPHSFQMAIVADCNARGIANLNNRELMPYIEAAQKIGRDVFLFRSIDELIEHYGNDQITVFVAKAAICHTILEAERGSTLLSKSDSGKFDLNHEKLEKSDAWIRELWFILRNGSRAESPQDVLNNSHFIIFNYDRCVEIFLMLAIGSIFNISDQDAGNLVTNASIVHPYGRIGSIQGYSGAVPYGQAENERNVYDMVQNIKTYGESQIDPTIMSKIDGMLIDAVNVIFIGFAYYPQNMRFFNRPESNHQPRTYGTVCGIYEENWGDIESSIRGSFKNTMLSNVPQLRDCKGAELLRRFQTALMA